MRVVSDTSPLVALAKLDELLLLPRLYGQVLVPPMVRLEFEEKLEEFGIRLPVATAVGLPQFLLTRPPQDRKAVARLRSVLDPGEAEALALAMEIRAEAVLIDEKRGRAEATALGLDVVGTLGILLEAKRLGLIANLSGRLARLDEIRFRINPVLRARFLRDAGESE